MIGLLYESREWSDYKLAAELAEAGCTVKMIDLALVDARDERASALMVGAALECDALVSRIFASAVFRGYAHAHALMAWIAEEAQQRDIPMINPARAHFFEVDKRRATEELGRAGVDVPQIFARGVPRDLDPAQWEYPCIIKPNCGGRTTYTALVRTTDEARVFLDDAPEIVFIVENYLTPENGSITRVELIDSTCALVVKRSVVKGGLSAYHLGSTYELYNDCPPVVRTAAEQAGSVLSVEFGSFDIIEQGKRAYVIDANAVSNVSPDNTATFGGFDLMRKYAQAIARRFA